MKNAVIYIHGKGGNALEAKHYETIFPEHEVIGFDYISQTPWQAKIEFIEYFDEIKDKYSSIVLIANSIGAFFVMNALNGKQIEKAYFISPIVDMEKLILDMMKWSNITEKQLKEKGLIETAFNETLSWEYLLWVRQHPISWNIPTAILYGSNDNLQSIDTIKDFSNNIKADLTIMQDGEHWFHTDKQMNFLDNWLSASK